MLGVRRAVNAINPYQSYPYHDAYNVVGPDNRYVKVDQDRSYFGSNVDASEYDYRPDVIPENGSMGPNGRPWKAVDGFDYASCGFVRWGNEWVFPQEASRRQAEADAEAARRAQGGCIIQ